MKLTGWSRDGCAREAPPVRTSPSWARAATGSAAASSDRQEQCVGEAARPRDEGCRAPSSAVFRVQQEGDASIMPEAAGAQAASATGSAPDWPNSSAILETTNNAKPAATPLPIIFATPPRRAGRMEKPADTSAMVAASSGSASSAWKCSR